MSRTYGKAQDLIDFTRASSGTALRRVKYGAELVTNGTFDSDISGWSDLVGTSTYSSGTLQFTSSAGGQGAYQAFPTVAGKVYRAEASSTSASISHLMRVHNTNSPSGGVVLESAVAQTSPSTFVVVFVAESSTSNIYLRNSEAGVVSWDNISVKEVTFDTSDGDLILFNHPNNIPRIEYDANGNVLGLLVEESRSNLIPYSDLSALWSLSNCTKTVNYATSPDGQSNATLFQATSNAQSYLIQSISKAASQIHYSLSVYVKKTNSRYASFRIQGLYPSRADVIFDLDTGLVHTSATTVLNFSNASESITPVGGGWYRISISALSDTATLITSVIAFSQNPIFVDGTETASDSSGLMHNIQLEAGSFPTSAISTSGSTATRSADVASLSTSAFGFNDREFTVAVKGTGVPSRPVGSTQNFTYFRAGYGAGKYLMMRFYSGATAGYAVHDAFGVDTTSQFDFNGATVEVPLEFSAGLVVSENDFAYINESMGAVETDTSGTVPDGSPTQIDIGNSDGLLQFNGHIKSLKYYPRRLTNAQLQELTS